MKQNIQELAIFLSGEYMGVPVCQEALNLIQSFIYDQHSTRFEILTNIDSALKKFNGATPSGVVAAIEILPLDNNKFVIKFVSDTALKAATKEAKTELEEAENLMSLFGKPPQISMFNDDSEFSNITNAINLIQQIERHQAEINASGTVYVQQSVLLKYIDPIEKKYLTPYLKTKE